MPSGGGLTPTQTIGLAGAALGGAMIGEGLRQLLTDDEDTPQKRSAREAKAAKDRQSTEGRLRAIRDRLMGFATEPGQPALALKVDDAPVSAGFSNPGRSTPSSPPSTRHMEAYVGGEKDAGDCLPQNSAGYCAEAPSPSAKQECIKNYQNGYRVGKIRAENTLRQAHTKGQLDKEAGRAPEKREKGAHGTCGAHWYTAYYAGYGGKPFNAAAR